jgi:SAM-dependent methyltransferase
MGKKRLRASIEQEGPHVSHASQLKFVELVSLAFPEHFTGSRVLEVGSLDINGSVRKFFRGCDYTGLDVASGPGVDVVCQGQEYDAPNSSFDVVISCEAMEHNPHWVKTFGNMIRLCRPAGLVVMTCATIGRPEHGTTRTEPESSPLTVGLGWNYYKNLSEKDFRRTFDLHEFERYGFFTKWNHFDLLFVGVKKGGQLGPQWDRATDAIANWIGKDDRVRALQYRRRMAWYFGDWWFKAMNRVTDRMVRATQRMERLHRRRDES